MNKNITRYKKYATALAASTAMMSSASAATIAWGAFDNDAAASEISINGTLVSAVNLVANNARVGTDTTTINGVTFTATNLLGNNYATSFNVSTGDANLDTLYASLSYGAGTITLSNLNIGDQYEIQAFYGDNRNATLAARQMNVGDGTTIATTSSAAAANGSWVIGTFTADAVTQSFHSAHSANINIEASGYQLRNLTATVPEPSSTALLGLAGIALILRRRK